MSEQVTVEKMPCGTSTTKTSFDDDGNLVRQDVTLTLDRKKLLLQMQPGILGAIRRIIYAGVEAGRETWNKH